MKHKVKLEHRNAYVRPCTTSDVGGSALSFLAIKVNQETRSNYKILTV